MRLNQKRALLSLFGPTILVFIVGIWFVASTATLHSLVPYQRLPGGWTEIEQKVTLVIGAVGAFFIPLGLIAAAVFWWLDRQEAKT